MDRKHNDPHNWKLGFIYFNPEDSRLFLPKRHAALGITVNFANPYSVLFLAFLVALFAFLSFLQN